MNSIAANRIVITGAGPLCREANCVADLLNASTTNLTDDPWFDPKTYLGKRGFKYHTQATRLLQSCVTIALKDAGPNVEDFFPENDRGVIIGTNFGVDKVLAEFDAIMAETSSDQISPMMAPNFSQNITGSHISLRRRYCAFNLTLTSPIVAGLEAIILASRAISQKRAKMVIAGAAEEVPSHELSEFLGVELVDEAACSFVVENYQSAIDREARVHLEVALYGQYCIDPHSNADWENTVNSVSAVVKENAHLFASKMALHLTYTSGDMSKRTNKLIKKLFADLNIETSEARSIGDDGRYVTVSPLLGVASLTAEKSSFIVSSSSQGHIVFLLLKKL